MQKTRPVADSGRGRGRPGIDRPAPPRGGVSEDRSWRNTASAGAGYAFGVSSHFSGGCVIGGFLQDKQGHACSFVGDGSALRRILRGGGSPAEKGSAFFWCSASRYWARPSLSVHPVLRPEVVQGLKRAGDRGHRGAVDLSGAFLTCFVRTACGAWAGAGHPGRVLGAGCAGICRSASRAVHC